MPNGIVTEILWMETCPAPECNLSDKDVEQFVEELNRYAKLSDPAFRHCERWAWGQVYLEGLLGDALLTRLGFSSTTCVAL